MWITFIHEISHINEITLLTIRIHFINLLRRLMKCGSISNWYKSQQSFGK